MDNSDNNEKKRLVIIDSHSLIHRAYHALPPLTTKKGQEVGAVYGFLLFFLKILKELNPDFIMATFDLPFPTFRHKKFKLYKANRPKTDPELSQQIPKTKEILESFGVPVFEKEGFEADDLIGTISKLAQEKTSFSPVEIIILSNDFDVMQLINSQTKVYSLKKGVKEGVIYDQNSIKDKYQGLNPEQLVDFKSLRGDPSDNIAGVKGIGEKNALWLIKEFGDLDNLYREIEEGTEKAGQIKSGIKKALTEQKGEALLSKELIRIRCDVPIDFNLEKSWFEGYDKNKVVGILNELEFYSLIKRLPDIEECKKDQNLVK